MKVRKLPTVKFGRCKIMMLLLAVALCVPCRASPDNGFFYNNNLSTHNVVTAYVLAIFSSAVNSCFDEDYPIFSGVGLYYEHRNLYDNNIRLSNPNPFEEYYIFWKWKYLFSNVTYSGKFGWQGAYSPIGIYARMDCTYECFDVQQVFEGEFLNRAFKISPGLGVRLALSMADWDTYPVVELGTSYDKIIAYNGRYGKDTKQLSEGMVSHYAVGVTMDGADLLLGLDLPHYDYFNKDYTPDGYYYPYANMTSKIFNVYIKANLRF